MSMFSRLSLVIAMALVVALAALPLRAQAQQPDDSVSVFLIDREAISGSPDRVDMLMSLVGLFFEVKEGQAFVFAFDERLANVHGPLETDADGIKDLLAAVEETLAAAPPAEPLDPVPALAETYNYLNGLNAGSASTIYYVSGNDAPTNYADLSDRLRSVSDLVAEAGWSTFDITLPGVSAELKRALDDVAFKTGGESFDLTVPDGLTTLADRVLRLEGKGALASVADATLGPGSVNDVNVDVLPGAGEMTLLLFRDDPRTAFRLENPDGFEASAGDRKSSTITEFPYLVIWELVDPAPGIWTLEIRGDGGRVSASQYSTNRYRLELQPMATAPVGEPLHIVAAVLDGDTPTALDAKVTARITDESGSTAIHDLRDDGAGGDSVASDGYYSATIPPVNVEGRYEVELQLSWEGIARAITRTDSFEASVFPSMTLDPVDTGIIQPGVRTKIATLNVNAGSQPLSVLPESITALVTTNEGEAGAVEIVPQRIISEGKAFAYDVFYTPSGEALATAVLTLEMEYAGRRFARSTDPIVVSSVQPRPAPPPAPTPAPPQPAPTTAPPPQPAPPERDTTTPIVAAVVIAVIVLLAIIAPFAYWLTVPKPFGAIYTEEGQLLVDVSDLPRSGMDKLTRRNLVAGGELGVPGLESVAIRFGRGQAFITTVAESPSTVRVNNQPVTGDTELHDGSWIGAIGRLYTFKFEIGDREG